MPNTNSKIKLKSINRICSELSLLSILLSVIFASAFSLCIFLEFSKKSLDIETQRLNDISPLIIRPMEANLIIGDERSTTALISDFTRKYNLNKLLITTTAENCPNNFLSKFLFIFKTPATCLTFPIPDTSPKEYLTLGSNFFKTNLSSIISMLAWVNIPLILLGFFSSWFLRKKLDKFIVRPMKTLTNNPNLISLTTSTEIAQEVNDLHEKLAIFIREEENQKINESKIAIATQVAHDIRSPIAALDVAVSIHSIPEDKRLLIRNATNRIRDIANNLLSQYTQKNSCSINNKSSLIKNEIIVDLISSVISEKRLRYHYLPVEIILDLIDIKYCTFVKLDGAEFKRVISNLIDNAVEAIENTSGSVKLKLSETDNNIILNLCDDGKGMPENQIDEILSGNSISTKKNGFGLGLSYSINKVTNCWNGNFEITSILNKGTTIILKFPKSYAPAWLASNINITPEQTIIILDDDKSIHDTWKIRLSKNKTINFYQANDFFYWYYSSHSQQKSNCVFLFDFELINGEHSGLDVFEKLELNKNCYLVTSHYETDDIQNRCKNLGVKLIPKSYVPYIPIIFSETSPRKTIIFIDDDKNLRSAWEFSAGEAGLNINTFSSYQAFNLKMNDYEKTIPIYIDSDLNESLKGEVYAKELYENGFKEIYLSTGYPAEKYQNMPWIKAIIGKLPPFCLDK
jgi:signal transduction histidine kinase/FixJ family two-component response regulator